MKATFITATILCFIVITSCESVGKYEDGNTKYTPLEIYGKKLYLYNAKMELEYLYYNFEVDSTCWLPTCNTSTLIFKSKKLDPSCATYLYRKVDNENAELYITVGHTNKENSDDMWIKSVLNLELNFTSAKTGNYKGYFTTLYYNHSETLADSSEIFIGGIFELE